MKLRTAILTCLACLVYLVIVVLVFIPLSAFSTQAPLNNANSYVMNAGVNPVTDSVSNVGEVVSSSSPTLILQARVAFMQDIANAAKGTLILDASNGNVISRAGSTTPTPVPDPILAAILTKWGVKVNDATGNQIFP